MIAPGAPVAGVVLAGGRASRMGGRDKAFAAVEWEPIAVRDVLRRLRVDYVSEAEMRAVRGAARSLTNVNTPEELAAVGGRFDDAP